MAEKKHVVQLQVVEELLDEGLARPRQLSLSRCTFGERPINGKEECILGTTTKCSDVPNLLKRLHQLVENQSLAEAIAAQIKAISEAVDSNKQIFFHHDKMHPDGLWIKDGEKPISDSSTLICDEAQRLGIYGNLNECEWVRNRKGRTFLCGDDSQRLNKRGDKGIGFILEGSDFAKIKSPNSIGTPRKIEMLVKTMLDEKEPPNPPKSFAVRLLHNDNAGLVSSFKNEPSGKKHCAILMSTGFYEREYVPHIMKSAESTDKCTEDCKGASCMHPCIRALSPLSDPDFLPERKDLSRACKSFCTEAFMPNYALSAYELISREVESIYLKIPHYIGTNMLRAPMDRAELNS